MPKRGAALGVGKEEIVTCAAPCEEVGAPLTRHALPRAPRRPAKRQAELNALTFPDSCFELVKPARYAGRAIISTWDVCGGGGSCWGTDGSDTGEYIVFDK